MIDAVGLSVLMSRAALRIHISSITADLLKATRLFELENRGEREVKVLAQNLVSGHPFSQLYLCNYQYSYDYPNVISYIELLFTVVSHTYMYINYFQYSAKISVTNGNDSKQTVKETIMTFSVIELLRRVKS